MKTQYTVVAVTLLVAQLGVQASPKSFVCPQSIPQASLRLLAPGQEWTPFISSPLYLSSAAPADGPPERLGVLRENASRKTQSGWMQKYSLDGNYPEGKWLRCDYGSFGEVSLAKRLPDEIRECTITGIRGTHAGESQVEVRCL